jgi:hypothetical protein
MFCTTEHTEARAHTQNHCTHTISLATNHFRKTKESALRSSPAVTRLTVYFRAHIQVRPHHFCMMHVLFRLVGMHAGVRACVFARVRVFTSVPVQLCVRARTLACTRVHLRGVCNEYIKWIQFWLRTSALRVPLVETRLTVYRRYQIRRWADRHWGSLREDLLFWDAKWW